MADNTDYSISENLPLLSEALNERSDAEKTSNVKENITGNFEVGPNPGFKNNSGGMAQAIVDLQDSAGTWAQDENKFAKYHLNLIKAFYQTMKNGLWLLGIEIPERM